MTAGSPAVEIRDVHKRFGGRPGDSLAGICAEKFDQLAAFQNFLVMPLTFLAGVFYSMQSLPPFWQAVAKLNPFFYAIDGFRYGFFGQSDVAPWTSLAFATAAFGALSFITLHLLRRGYWANRRARQPWSKRAPSNNPSARASPARTSR